MEPGYFPPFHLLRDGLEMSEDGRTVKMSAEMLRMFVKVGAKAMGFDPAWYRAEYPDVAEAIEAGVYADELDHFASSGFEEGRVPAYVPVDEEWYYSEYTDIAEAVASGEVADGETHFFDNGYLEGRAPSEAANLWVSEWHGAIEKSSEVLHEDNHEPS